MYRPPCGSAPNSHIEVCLCAIVLSRALLHIFGKFPIRGLHVSEGYLADFKECSFTALGLICIKWYLYRHNAGFRA